MAPTTIHNRITVDPQVMLGKPVIAGTRMPVYLVVELLDVGQSAEQIASDCPELTEADVEAAEAFIADERSRTEYHVL